MRYPWVALSICAVWVATLLVISFQTSSATTIFIYATFTVLVIFFLGFTRGG